MKFIQIIFFLSVCYISVLDTEDKQRLKSKSMRLYSTEGWGRETTKNNSSDVDKS